MMYEVSAAAFTQPRHALPQGTDGTSDADPPQLNVYSTTWLILQLEPAQPRIGTRTPHVRSRCLCDFTNQISDLRETSS